MYYGLPRLLFHSKLKYVVCNNYKLVVVHNVVKNYEGLLFKGPIISEDMRGIFQLPKKYSVFLSLACWRLSFEFLRTFLESVSKS